MLLFLSNSKFSFNFAADLKSIPEHHQRRRCLFVAGSWTNGFAALCEGARLISPSLIMAKKKLSESRRVSPNVNLGGQLEESAGAAKLSDIGQLRQLSNKNVVLINANQTGENAKKNKLDCQLTLCLYRVITVISQRYALFCLRRFPENLTSPEKDRRPQTSRTMPTLQPLRAPRQLGASQRAADPRVV